MPNITGEVWNTAAQSETYGLNGLSVNGAFSKSTRNEGVGYAVNTKTGLDGFKLNVSGQTSLFGKSSIVQPKSFRLFAIVRT